ncbi:hypothetical protein D9758_018770, partial [Tetrapyrgos nigripes]
INLDVLHLQESHTGENLAKFFAGSLKSFGIETKTLGIAMDNASNNDKLLECIPEHLPCDSLVSTETQIRCFGHILNLAAKAFLSVFFTKSKADDDDDDDDDDLELVGGYDGGDVPSDEELGEDEIGIDGHAQLADRGRAERDEIELLTNGLHEVKELTEEDLNMGSSMTTKLRKLGKAFRYKPEPKRDLANACKNNSIKAQNVKHPVGTRWNTWSDVVDRVSEIRMPLDDVVGSNKYSRGGKGKTKLSHLQLDDDEWSLLEEIKPILQWFTMATSRVSTSNRPLLSQVIPLIDTLTDSLLEIQKDWSKSALARAGAAKAIAILNKYYSKTDDTIMYKVTMIIHPLYKLKYFKDSAWEKEWIDIAEKTARDHFEKHYLSGVDNNVSQPKEKPAPKKNDIFAKMDEYGQDNTDNEEDVFTVYLREKTTAEDPISYWTKRLDKPNAKCTPQGALAQMGLDFCSAPAASTDVERLFSGGGLLVTDRRHNLSFPTMQAAMCLNSWFDAGLVPEEEVVKMFNQLSSRRRVKDLESSDEDSSSDEDEVL